MSNLVIMQERQAVTTSLMIAEVFEKRHDHVLRDIEDHIKDLVESRTPKVGSEMFVEGSYVSRGKEYKQYFMNRDGFSLLVMSFNNTKGVLDWKLKYIEAFNEMEKQLRIQAPTNMIEALTLALEQQKEIESKDKKILELEPKALFADSVSSSKTSILIGDLAKILKQKGCDIGQNRLFEKLRQEGFLIRRPGSSFNTPTQLSMNMGLMEITQSSYISSNGVAKITKTTRVTGKGQIYFVNRYLGGNQNDLDGKI